MELHEKLDIPREKLDDALEKFNTRTYRDKEYRHIPDYRKNIEKGTVIIDEEVVRGWPKIPRTLNLENGIQNFFDQEFLVEEKLDGYNARIAYIDEIYAFSRSGIICPFTTKKSIEELNPRDFFEEHPDLMICGEMIGDKNPYTRHQYPDINGVEFRVFDIQHQEKGNSVGIEKRNELCSEYNLPLVSSYGIYQPNDSVNKIREIIDELNTHNREGIVMKTLDSENQLKYTTSSTNISDLEYAFSLPFDYGRDFMFRRIIREGFQSVEWRETRGERKERARQLGEAILLPMIETIQEIQNGGKVGEEHTVKGEKETVEELISHLKDMGLNLRIDNRKEKNGEIEIDFTKITNSTNDKTDLYLDGHPVRE